MLVLVVAIALCFLASKNKDLAPYAIGGAVLISLAYCTGFIF